MRKKAKALKAVEPNAGVRKAYTKAVTKIERDFQSYVLNRVLLFWSLSTCLPRIPN